MSLPFWLAGLLAWQHLLLAHSWERKRRENPATPTCTIEVIWGWIWQVFSTLPRQNCHVIGGGGGSPSYEPDPELSFLMIPKKAASPNMKSAPSLQFPNLAKILYCKFRLEFLHTVRTSIYRVLLTRVSVDLTHLPAHADSFFKAAY